MKQIKYNDFIPFFPVSKLALCTMARYSVPEDPESFLTMKSGLRLLRVVAAGIDDPVLNL